MSFDPEILAKLFAENDLLRQQVEILKQQLEQGSTVLESDETGGTGTPPASEASSTEEPTTQDAEKEEKESSLDAMLRRIEERRGMSPMERQRYDELERAAHAERMREANAAADAQSQSAFAEYKRRRASDPKGHGLRDWEKPKS